MGVQDRNTIDFLVERTDGSVQLVLQEPHAWGEYPEQLGLLREKLEAYAEYVMSGELTAQHPDAEGKENDILVACLEAPWGDYASAFRAAAAAFGEYGVKIVVTDLEMDGFDTSG